MENDICACCGASIDENDPKEVCTQCGRIKCANCDAGTGTVCPDCEIESLEENE